MAVRWLDGGPNDAIAVDDTYFPVIISTWFGPASEKAVRAYFAWLEEMLARAVREDTPIVNLCDSGAADVPSSEVRRLMSELTEAWVRRGADDRRVFAYVVVENALIRGVLTALSWLHGGMKISHFATCEQALTAAREALVRVRRAAPAGLDPSRYRRPISPFRAAGPASARGRRELG